MDPDGVLRQSAADLLDRVDRAPRRIRADQALVLAESRKYAGVPVACLIAAGEAVAANDPERYQTVVSSIEDVVPLTSISSLHLPDSVWLPSELTMQQAR